VADIGVFKVFSEYLEKKILFGFRAFVSD